ncbi:MAG: ParB N-terminal domain-containing protein [Pseudomonadota bacterium]
MTNFFGVFKWSKKKCRDDEVKSFQENQDKEEAFEMVNRGVRTIPLDRIVGSVGRYHDFDKSFKPKHHLHSERLENIRRAMESGKPMPPVFLYQIKDEYYVVDGNHRVSVAKELGLQEIEASILEFISSKKTVENILYLEKSDFREKTKLKTPLELTEIGQYANLLKQISQHRDFLAKNAGKEISLEKAASDWYATIYYPLASIINKGKLLKHFPGRTIADLYSYITAHHWEPTDQERQYGIGISRFVPRNMEEFREMMSHLNENEYPEMVREITAFVLMNVAAKKEYRVVEKLFELDEIKEIHSVHGAVDIIAKVVLKRNLLFSDAETIGEFVHLHIRQVAGVISTQTLIPSRSQIKPGY